MPQVGEDVDTTRLHLGSLWVLVLVNHVLGCALDHQPVRVRIHPGGHERGQIEPRVAVEHQLVVDDLVRGLRGDRLPRHPEPRDHDVLARPGELGPDVDGLLCLLAACLAVQSHHR